MEKRNRRRWLTFTIREWFLALVALGFAIAWGRELSRRTSQPLTFEQAVDLMRREGSADQQIVSQEEENGEWFEYRLTRKSLGSPSQQPWPLPAAAGRLARTIAFSVRSSQPLACSIG
jgi:hypothetical protein